MGRREEENAEVLKSEGSIETGTGTLQEREKGQRYTEIGSERETPPYWDTRQRQSCVSDTRYARRWSLWQGSFVIFFHATSLFFHTTDLIFDVTGLV